MKIHCLPLGNYQTNCYVLHAEDSKTCAVIDPGYEASTILDKVKSLGLTIDAILLTHGHFDHVGAVEEIVKNTGCQLWMSESDWSQFPNPVNIYFYPLANCDFTNVHFCEEGEQICAGGLTFSVTATPGHTYGSVCYFCENAMFSGDTLFARSIGRTDLPGGDWNTMKQTLEQLSEIRQDYAVYPGHGSASTLYTEQKYNPYLR